MTLDQPWKIAALIGLLAFLRIVWGLWRRAPGRAFMVELLDSGMIAFLLVFLLIRPFVVQSFFIPSGSMIPTLMPGDRILVNKFVYRMNPPRRGDVVVFDAPPQALRGDSRKDFVKRLIGMSGDHIQIKADDGVYIDGMRLLEPDDIARPNYNWPVDRDGFLSEYRVPEGCYLVLGDNRSLSHDSHSWSDPRGRPMPELEAERLVGKALAIFWPPWRMRLVSDNRELEVASERQDRLMAAVETQPARP